MYATYPKLQATLRARMLQATLWMPRQCGPSEACKRLLVIWHQLLVIWHLTDAETVWPERGV
jgi:hypothetical protein